MINNHEYFNNNQQDILKHTVNKLHNLSTTYKIYWKVVDLPKGQFTLEPIYANKFMDLKKNLSKALENLPQD